MKRRTLRLRWSVVLAGAFIVGLSAPAHASHQDLLPDPDNTTQCVKSPSIVPKTVIARNQGFAQLDRTDIDTQYCTGDDIWVQDYTYGATGWYAHAFCDDKTLAGRCDIYIVQFNESTYGSVKLVAEIAGMSRVWTHRQHRSPGLRQRHGQQLLHAQRHLT